MPKQQRKRLTIDLDHTIYDGSYDGSFKMIGESIEDSQWALELIASRYDVIIGTARLWDQFGDENEQRTQILRWLYENGFDRQTHFHHVTNKKIPSVRYIDDKAEPFKGSWKDIITSLKKQNIL